MQKNQSSFPAATKLFTEFFNSEKTGGLLLLGCTVLSLIIANSTAGQSYIEFWHRKLDLSAGGLELNYSIEHWINDGLMAVFFLLIGLEIERELYKGELASVKNAITPVVAAIGGMVFPALFHFLFNVGTATQNGLGIPMATDIAFALGMLSLLGNRVPVSLKIFLTALAIIDDLGAITVIAVFYSKSISAVYLLAAIGIFVLLLVFQKMKVYRLFFYILPGIVMWYCMLKSGVHATIAGVLLAFAIPFGKNDETNPSYKLQHILHKPVAFILLPVFALANTALLFNNNWINELKKENSLGIITGLFLGKPIGIVLFCWLLVKTRLGTLPNGISWRHILGAGFLAGIGFTMSIFITNLAFTDNDTIQYSKIAVLAGSLISCITGLIILYFTKKNDEVI